MPIWANQVSPLQNWCSIIYIHNDMINSVRYAELGEARLARRIDIENNLNSCAPHTTGESGFVPTRWYSIFYAYCDAIIFGMLCRFGRGTPSPAE